MQMTPTAGKISFWHGCSQLKSWASIGMLNLTSYDLIVFVPAELMGHTTPEAPTPPK